MRLILDIESVDGSQQTAWMTDSQDLRIGRSSRADVCVEGDAALIDIHFVITGGPDGWSLQAARGAKVGVNGVPEQRCRLKHGDCIVAGQTEFRVTIEGQPVAEVARTAVQSPELTAKKTPFTANMSMCASGVAQIVITLNDTPLIELVKKICGDAGLWVAVNEQRLGGSIQLVNKQTEDLFAQAPEEIRATDSLVLGDFELSSQVLTNIQSASRADGALMFVSSEPFPKILAEQKIVWAWYSRPSIFKQQLTLGSKELAKKLLSAVEIAILLNTVDGDVLVLARADMQESLQKRLA